MARKTTVVLTGDKKLNQKLARLAGKDAKKIIRGAARKALKPVQREAQRRAPVASGKLRRAIKVRAMKRSRVKFGARVTIGDKTFTGKTFYGGFQEWGWKTGKRGSGRRREVEGKHFLEGAADATRRAALGIYRAQIKLGLINLAKK